MSFAKNLLREPLETCSCDPMTGFYRTGDCFTGEADRGVHVVCALMSADFLAFSLSRGNDLVTPRPEFDFPGLKPGDHWCICVERWVEARDAGCAPRVDLLSTHEAALKYATLESLMEHAIDEEEDARSHEDDDGEPFWITVPWRATAPARRRTTPPENPRTRAAAAAVRGSLT
jgi:uncharacterized protein (DUF2237 family)